MAAGSASREVEDSHCVRDCFRLQVTALAMHWKADPVDLIGSVRFSAPVVCFRPRVFSDAFASKLHGNSCRIYPAKS